MSFGKKCVEHIRGHLNTTGTKWSQLNGDKVAELIDARFAIDFPQAGKMKRVNGRDVLFDAIAIACNVDLMGLTRNYAKQIATAKRDIVEASPNVTPADIETRAASYRRKYRDAALTPMALATRWPELGTNGVPGQSAKKPDAYVEPVGWRQSVVAQRASGLPRDVFESLCGRLWLDVPPDIRSAIVAALR